MPDEREKKVFQASLTSNEMSAHTFLRAVKVNVPLSSGILTDFRWKRGSNCVVSTVEAMTVTVTNIYIYIK